MFTNLLIIASLLAINPAQNPGGASVELASHTISLDKRYADEYVNGVFKDNILLTLSYMSNRVNSKNDIRWDDVNKDFTYEFKLEPGGRFAFHNQTLPKFEGITKTTNAHFNYTDGFKSDGYLIGDGVCHLASLIYWVAKDANLDAYAPTNHDFAQIPEISKENGVSIFSTDANQNLYITNNFDKPVNFAFEYKSPNLKLSITKDIK